METPDLNATEIKPNPLKSEHLIEGVPAIMACIGTEDDYGPEIKDMKNSGENIDYSKNTTSKDGDHLSDEDRAYVISGIDNGTKFTKNIYMCTSIVAVGIDKDTGENISFLTHQDYPSVDENINFETALKTRIKELTSRCVEGTVDIVITGGMLSQDFDYIKKMKKLDSIVVDVMGYSPVAVCGPKESGYYNDNIYFDTKNRRLYVVRPKDSVVYNDSFIPSELDELNEKWKEKKEKS